jgi:hypothetical protein
MNPRILLATILVLASTPVFALTVHLDYDKDYDFTTIHTYQWVPTKSLDVNPIVEQRIINAVNYELGNRGKRLVESDPDILVTYYANSREELNLNSTDIVPTNWHSYYGQATQTVHSYRVGTLIIDAVDAKTKKLVWRAMAEDTVKPDPDKIEGKINNALKKIAKEWDRRAR